MKVETTMVVEVDLRTTPYREWPERAKVLARIFLERELRSRQPDAFLRERIVAKIEAHVERDLFDI